MSHFMSSMPSAGLMLMPPVSKQTPLPTKATGWLSPPPFHWMTPAGCRDAALADAQQAAHAQLPSRLFTEDLDLQAEGLERLDPFGELDRIEDVRRLGDQIAGEVDRLAQRLQRRVRRLRGGDITSTAMDDGLDRGLLFGLLGRAVFVEAIGGEHDAERSMSGQVGAGARQQDAQRLNAGGLHRGVGLGREGLGDLAAQSVLGAGAHDDQTLDVDAAGATSSTVCPALPPNRLEAAMARVSAPLVALSIVSAAVESLPPSKAITATAPPLAGRGGAVGGDELDAHGSLLKPVRRA
jgi:hypothetical protein